MKFYAKMVPKFSEHLCKNVSKINATIGSEKDEETHEI